MKKLLNKPLCITALALAFVYGLSLPFFWGNDPTTPTGTLSLLCEDRKLYFWLWGVLTSGGIILNTQYMYRKYGYKNKLFNAMCALAFLSMCGIALTLGHDIDSWNPKRLAHWIATGMFIAFTMAPIALFFIVCRKRYKHFNLFTVCTFLILATFIVIFAVVGKSGLMEMVPLAMMEAFLFVVNFVVKDSLYN